ncbi:hypothetical protein [Photobacterium arenosum]|uniref:hypothetical protein n=1 Tax=Photobacterium arenosum TaxID=2774143 RepID=UPI00288A69CA|nr:hypothetical protein [Photobacterium arenosum]
MHPLQNGSQVEVKPAAKPKVGPAGYFTEGGEGTAPSYPGADWFNAVIEEFKSVYQAAGLTFEPNKFDHLKRAISANIAEHSDPEKTPDPHPQYPLKGTVTPLEEFSWDNHYQRGLILLIPYIDETSPKANESIVCGSLMFRRGNAGSGNRFEVLQIRVRSSYNYTNYSMDRGYVVWGWTFCIVNYMGQRWLALKSQTDNVQSCDCKFIGFRRMGPEFPDHQFRFMTYETTNPAYPPTNPELATEIVSISGFEPLRNQNGNPYYSRDLPPEIPEIPQLDDRLGALVSRQTMIGSIVEFSTDAPRPGFVKAQRMELSRFDYPQLWTLASSASNLAEQSTIDESPDAYAAYYGTGDGITTFTTPDYHQGHYRRGAQSSLVFGEAQGDAIRNIEGFATLNGLASRGYLANESGGAFAPASNGAGRILKNDVATDGYNGNIGLRLDASRVVPTAEENRPKTINTYVYIYHGEETA